MKIEKLNENKIRITLNLDDLNERNIDLHSFMSNSIESQNIFLDMLDKADEEVGFNTDDCRIMIEALALKDGHFVLTITKFEQYEDEKSPSTAKKRSLHIKRKSPTVNFDKTIYSFESFDAFCDFCTFLRGNIKDDELNRLAKSIDLYEYNSNFYLIFSDINVKSNYLKFICSSITEFAHFVNSSELFERKVKEYGKLVIKSNALMTCMEYFV